MIELLVVVGIISILAMVGIPAYTDYTVRSKVISDFVLAREPQLMVAEYYAINGVLPESNEELGLPRGREIQGEWLRSARVQPRPEAGTIRLVYDHRGKLQALENRSVIRWVPEIIGDTLIWDCTSGSMDDKYRPPSCRN